MRKVLSMNIFKKLKEYKDENLTADKVKAFGFDMLICFFACCVSAFSIVGVMIPNGLTSGGITGIIRIVQKFVDIDFSILYMSVMILVLVLVLVTLGWKELRKIVIISLMFPVVLRIFELTDFRLLETRDTLLAAVFCGIFTGIYIGLVFWRGYASAGTDAIVKVLKKKFFPEVNLSKLLLAVDGTIIIASAFVYGRNIALYALITQVIITKVSDVIMYGLESKLLQVTIVTDKPDGIHDYVIDELDRGLTISDVTGGYTGRMRKQIRVLCSQREAQKLRKAIREIDPAAFVTVTKIDAVWGTGKDFSDI